MRWLLLGGLALPLWTGCGDDGGGSDDTSASGSSGTGPVTTTMVPTTDPMPMTGDSTGDSTATDDTMGSSGTGDEGEGSLGQMHGVVTLQFEAAEGAPAGLLDGTARVSVTVGYASCMRDFYDANPPWARDGADGMPIFDASIGGGLCGFGEANDVACSVMALSQNVTVAYALNVEYTVTSPVEGNVLRVGPLPTRPLSLCDADQNAVIIGSAEAIRGFDGAGNTLWQAESFSPMGAPTDDPAPIVIMAGPPA